MVWKDGLVIRIWPICANILDSNVIQYNVLFLRERIRDYEKSIWDSLKKQKLKPPEFWLRQYNLSFYLRLFHIFFGSSWNLFFSHFLTRSPFSILKLFSLLLLLKWLFLTTISIRVPTKSEVKTLFPTLNKCNKYLTFYKTSYFLLHYVIENPNSKCTKNLKDYWLYFKLLL